MSEHASALASPDRFTQIDLNVRYWHLADILFSTSNVRFWGKADMASASQNGRL